MGRAQLLPHTVARSLCLLLVCASALAPALPALASPSAPATTSEGMAPRRRDVAAVPLFRNLKIMVHAEVGLIGAPNCSLPTPSVRVRGMCVSAPVVTTCLPHVAGYRDTCEHTCSRRT